MYVSVRFSSHLRNALVSYQARHYRLLYNLEFSSMGKWGFCENNIPLKEVASDKSSLSGASLRAPSLDKSAFALCIWRITSFQTAPFTNCALCYHYSFIQGLSWWNQHPPASSLITLSQSDEDIFYLTSCFHQRWQKEKKKTKRSHTHSSKQRTKNITLNNLPLV